MDQSNNSSTLHRPLPLNTLGFRGLSPGEILLVASCQTLTPRIDEALVLAVQHTVGELEAALFRAAPGRVRLKQIEEVSTTSE